MKLNLSDKISKDVLRLLIAMFLWGIGESAFLIFQPLYLEEFGASPVTIGTILGIIGISMTISHFPAGYLSDRIDPRYLLWGAWILGTAAGLIMIVANSFQAYVVGAALYGISAFVIAPLSTYITIARRKLSVGRVLTLISAAFNAGAVIGPSIGGWIAQAYSIRMIFTFSLICFVLSTILIIPLKGQPIPTRASSQRLENSRLKLVGATFLVVFFVMFAMYLPYPLAANYLKNYHQITYQQIGQLGSVLSLGTVVMNLLFGFMSPMMGILSSQVMVIITSVLLLRGSTYPVFAAGLFAFGGYRSARTLLNAEINSLTEYITAPGIAYGLVETFASLGIVFSPIVAGYLYDRSPSYIYITAIILITLSIPAVFSFQRIRQKLKTQVLPQVERRPVT